MYADCPKFGSRKRNCENLFRKNYKASINQENQFIFFDFQFGKTYVAFVTSSLICVR